MNPQLTKIAECLSETHAREIKLARCLAESLKRIQTLEAAASKEDKKAKATEARFNAALRGLADTLAKDSETKAAELSAKMERITLEFPAQLAALKSEFAAQVGSAPKSFNPRGAYQGGETYKAFDFVSSNGSSYIALVDDPTEPPSKRSKQWMLVAARGGGGGVSTVTAQDVIGLATVAISGSYNDLSNLPTLGTAATRDVGQLGGNIPTLTANGTLTLGGVDGFSGVITLWDNDLNTYRTISDAAFRSVGQLAGNVPEFGTDGQLTLGEDGVADGRLYLWNDNISALGAVYPTGNTFILSTGGSSVAFTGATGKGAIFDYSANTATPRTYTLPDASGTLALTSDLTALQSKAEVKSGNFTAANDGVYTITASATVTDPTPVQGNGFTVFVRNGTATVGGTAYATAGTIIRRIFHSGAWANYEYQVTGGGGGVPTSRTLTTTAPLTIDGGASADLSANRTLAVSTATTTTSGVVGGIGGIANSANAATIKQVNSLLNIRVPLTSSFLGTAATNGSVSLLDYQGTATINAGAAGASALFRVGNAVAILLGQDSGFGPGWFDASWRIDFSFNVRFSSPTSTHKFRFLSGTSAKAAGTLAEKGLGIEAVPNGANLDVYAVAHNGTTYASELLVSMSSYTFKQHAAAIIKNGTSMAIEINGVTYASTLSNLPTGNAVSSTSNAFQLEAQDTNNPSSGGTLAAYWGIRFLTT